MIESRESVAWTRELVGSIALADFAELEELQDELICLLWQAVVGTSRLPLTSVEAPLPAFSFGKLHYVARTEPQERPMNSLEQLVTCFDEALATKEQTKLIEFNLRRGSRVEALQFLSKYPRGPSMAMWRDIFNEVSLSPYTNFVDNARRVHIGHRLRSILAALTSESIHRHLTAYDLVTFIIAGELP